MTFTGPGLIGLRTEIKEREFLEVNSENSYYSLLLHLKCTYILINQNITFNSEQHFVFSFQLKIII